MEKSGGRRTPERATPSGAFPEPVLEPTATVRWSACAWVPRAAGRRPPAAVAYGTWAVVRPKADAVKPAKGNDELGWAVAGECRDL